MPTYAESVISNCDWYNRVAVVAIERDCRDFVPSHGAGAPLTLDCGGVTPLAYVAEQLSPTLVAADPGRGHSD